LVAHDGVDLRAIGSRQDGEIRAIEIESEMICRGQLLQLSALPASSADARQLLLARAGTVNGDREARRGLPLQRGDMVAMGMQSVRVVSPAR
jgi:ribosome-associated protein YbcJ (S4-like RNA binding protein)